MSLKRNITANYVSQLYVTLIGIVMVPMYVQYMGMEAYGLVGFFAMLQAWFQLLDLGLTPTMSRETARFRGGATGGDSLRALLRSLEWIFIAVAVFGCLMIIFFSDTIASTWLKVEKLPLIQVERSITLMAVIVALRWVSGLYRGAINGFEQLVWLSGFNIAIATLRFVLVIPFFIYVGTSPVNFFNYQLAIAFVELFVLVYKTYALFPPASGLKADVSQWMELKAVIRFSLGIAFTGSVWVFVTQTDKLLLSKLLPLSEYAHFTLAVLVASGVSIISGPISGALLPRLTRLAAEGDETGLRQLYCNATQFVCAIAIPAALVLAVFAEKILWAWTGDQEISNNAANVLRLYALGNGMLALGAFPYYLQFAKGDLRLHLIGNIIFLVFLIPALIFATSHYGMTGAGYVWLTVNVLYFLLWVPMVHRRLAAGMHGTWLVKYVGTTALFSLLGTLAVSALPGWPQERLPVAIEIAVVSTVVLLIALSSIVSVRERFMQKLRLTT